MGFRTRQIHAGVTPDPTTGAILTPIHQSTTFVQPSVDEYLSKGYTYSRSGNPTVKVLEAKLAELEGGVDCACFGTGMGATTAVMLAFLGNASAFLAEPIGDWEPWRTFCETVLLRPSD